MSSTLRGLLLLTLLISLVGGCAKSPPPKPKAADWAVRKLDGGVSLEAPYAFASNPNALPGYVNIASYMPEKGPNALEIRIDVLQQPIGVEEPTLEQFAKAVFTFDQSQKESSEGAKIDKVQVSGLEGLRNKAQSKVKTLVESVVFKKGKFFWLVEVYYLDDSLAGDAKRVLDSVKVE